MGKSRDQGKTDLAYIEKFIANILEKELPEEDSQPTLSQLVGAILDSAKMTKWRLAVQRVVTKPENVFGPVKSFIKHVYEQTDVRPDERTRLAAIVGEEAGVIASERRANNMETMRRQSKESLEAANRWADLPDLKEWMTNAWPRFEDITKAAKESAGSKRAINTANFKWASAYCMVLCAINCSTVRGSEWGQISYADVVRAVRGADDDEIPLVKVLSFKNQKTRMGLSIQLDKVTRDAWREFHEAFRLCVPRGDGAAFFFVRPDGGVLEKTAKWLTDFMQDISGQPELVLTATSLRKIVESHAADVAGPEDKNASDVFLGNDHSGNTSAAWYQKRAVDDKARAATTARATIGIAFNPSAKGAASADDGAQSDDNPRRSAAKAPAKSGKRKVVQEEPEDSEDGAPSEDEPARPSAAKVPAKSGKRKALPDEPEDSDEDADEPARFPAAKVPSNAGKRKAVPEEPAKVDNAKGSDDDKESGDSEVQGVEEGDGDEGVVATQAQTEEYASDVGSQDEDVERELSSQALAEAIAFFNRGKRSAK
jgi:hypothetical protein